MHINLWKSTPLYLSIHEFWYPWGSSSLLIRWVMILGVQGIKQIWTSCPFVHNMRGNQCLWKAVWLVSPQGLCISCLDCLFSHVVWPVIVAVLQTRELKNKHVRSFPKVTLTVSQWLGWKKSPAYPKNCHFSTGQCCAWAHGLPCLLQGLIGSTLYRHLHQASNAQMLPMLLLIWESLLCKGLVNLDVFSQIPPSHVHCQGKASLALGHQTHAQLPSLLLQVLLRTLFPRNSSLLTWTIGQVWEAEGKWGTFKCRGAECSLFPAEGCTHSYSSRIESPKSRTRGMLPFKTHVPRLGAVIFICQPLNSKCVFFSSSKKTIFSFLCLLKQ